MYILTTDLSNLRRTTRDFQVLLFQVGKFCPGAFSITPESIHGFLLFSPHQHVVRNRPFIGFAPLVGSSLMHEEKVPPDENCWRGPRQKVGISPPITQKRRYLRSLSLFPLNQIKSPLLPFLTSHFIALRAVSDYSTSWLHIADNLRLAHRQITNSSLSSAYDGLWAHHCHQCVMYRGGSAVIAGAEEAQWLPVAGRVWNSHRSRSRRRRGRSRTPQWCSRTHAAYRVAGEKWSMFCCSSAASEVSGTALEAALSRLTFKCGTGSTWREVAA